MSPSIILEKVFFRSLDQESHFFDIFMGMHSFDDGGTELIVRSSCFYKLYAFLIPGNIRIFSGKRSILSEYIFHIHGDIIDELLIQEISERFGIAPVGVEFHEESEIFDPLAEPWKIRVDSRLSSTDDHSIEKPLSGF